VVISILEKMGVSIPEEIKVFPVQPRQLNGFFKAFGECTNNWENLTSFKYWFWWTMALRLW
jgi:hypothetical protein